MPNWSPLTSSQEVKALNQLRYNNKSTLFLVIGNG
jgi:hypothetical protein